MIKPNIFRILFIVAVVVLLGNVLLISRDYQDSWVLEGLEVPFAIFVIIYVLAFFSEKRVPYMIVLAVIGGCVFLLVPSLKYNWFQGAYIDQHQQYALTNYVCKTGHIATDGPTFVSLYNSTPFIHLDFAILSIVSNMPVADAFKFLPVFLFPIYPSLTYVIIKNMKFLHTTRALRYALFFSSIPTSLDRYYVTGSQFGILLAFLVIGSLVMLLQCKSGCRRRWLILIFLVTTLAASHVSSTILAALFLFLVMLIQRIPYFRMKSYLKVPAITAVTLICITWLVFPARFSLEQISRAFIGSYYGTTTVESLPSRFFELISVNFVATARSALATTGADIPVLMLTLGSLVALLKLRKRLDNISKLLFLIGGVGIAFVPISFLLRVGGFRTVHFLIPLFPIFSAVFFLQIIRKRRWIQMAIISTTIILATLQLYGCQPLLPPANVLSKGLPENEPILYINNVNSIYQRKMIEFATNHVNGRVACDSITRNQMAGLANFTFYVTHIVRYYPLGKDQSRIEYEFFLIHLPGVSGGFEEQAETRTRDLILEAIYNSTITYTNGESYVLSRTDS